MKELVIEVSGVSVSGKNQSSCRSEFPAVLFLLDDFYAKD